ncbi:hypothetical protein CRENBAI_008760 [Crenichthys baileyi]|uniref:Uncharacterized protein n=1 Tax=Crenichthys baileyi TaxID=28760 RepID=A0AAV9SEK2_9TELE
MGQLTLVVNINQFQKQTVALEQLDQQWPVLVALLKMRLRLENKMFESSEEAGDREQKGGKSGRCRGVVVTKAHLRVYKAQNLVLRPCPASITVCSAEAPPPKDQKTENVSSVNLLAPLLPNSASLGMIYHLQQAIIHHQQ